MTQERMPYGERAIAVVGVSCRLPGGIMGMADLWAALHEGRDVIGEMPADRIDTRRFVDTEVPRPGKSYTAAGGFLQNVVGFDAAFFGISPKEAAHMDPQQRLLLELAAEALDDAGIAPSVLAGSDTAVYVGISDASYGVLQMLKPRSVGPYTMSGAALSIAANRISHAFDLRGPSMAIDTACSSSLVAIDRACHALWEGTSRTALCGGANMLLSPGHFIGFSQASMLSRRGRCAAFSADADGFVRAEGGGLVLLKRLEDALADGDRVHGVILGSATNSDGRTMGLALPRPEAQEALLRGVYAEFGVPPDSLVYFEAHGTGTAVGDPAEAQAIGQALGVRRITGPLPIGSVKTNLGHLEPASGIAGLCKALLVLRHREIPATLHADPPHPEIDFTGLGLALATENRPLGDVACPVVGVNSFGFGGSNAHVILASTPPARRPAGCPPPPEGLPVLVTARTAQALREATSRMAERLTAVAPGEFYDVAYTSCLRRGKHELRTAVLAGTAREAADRLQDATRNEAAAATEAVRSGRVAFVFAGNGSQWAGMGADLLATDPVFSETVAALDAELTPLLGWSVAEKLALPPEQWRLTATEEAQPLLFAVQLGITAALRAQGVTPFLVMGHSVGEVAAACISESLTTAQAAQVIAARSSAQAATVRSGRMAAAGLGPEQAAEALKDYAGRLEIAGVNSDRDVTVTGDPGALAELGGELTQRGVFFRDLELDYAFHSRAMDSLRAPLAAALRDLAPGPASVPLYSTVTGTRLPGTDLDAEYWWRNVRRPVQFAAAVEAALDDGADIFLEIGPHPVLQTYLRRVTHQRPQTPTAVMPTLRRDEGGPRTLAAARAALIAAGAHTPWDRYFPQAGRVAELPPYPWQRKRHWGAEVDVWARTGPLEHPLLGSRVPAPTPSWEGSVEPALVPWLADHRVAGSVVMPATGYAEIAAAAGRAALGAPAEVEHLDISSALVIPWADASGTKVHVSFNPDDGRLLIAATNDQTHEPRPHAQARVRALVTPRPASLTPDDLRLLRERCPRTVTAEEHYSGCAAAGLEYGPAFRTLTELHLGDGEVLAHYAHESPGDPYTLHPALLDGALQAGAPLLADKAAEGCAYLPVAIAAVRVWSTPSPRGTVTVRQRLRTDEEVCWDITLADPDGTVTVQLDGCRLRRYAATLRTPLAVQHTVLRAAPHPEEPTAPSPLPSPAAVLDACAERIGELRTAYLPLRSAQNVEDNWECYTAAFAAALAGLLPDGSRPFTTDDLVRGGLTEQHLRLFTQLTPSLRQYGLLAPEADGRHRWTPEAVRPRRTLADVVEAFPTNVSVQALLAQQIQHLGELLRGQRDPTDLLTDEVSAKALELTYDITPFCRFYNRIAQALLSEIVRCWPVDRPLRVLEIGAGTGGTTAALLPLLPAERTRYCFTDVSTFFLSRAQNRFSRYDFVEYRTFDLDQDPLVQGYALGGFDVVVASNALHTARDLRAALRRARDLLAPGGALLAVETHDPRVVTPIFGMLDSAYSRTDTDLRPDSLLLPREEWPGLLEQCGFGDIVQTGADRPAYDHGSVLLASVPARSAGEPEPRRLSLPEVRRETSFLVVAETPDAHVLAAATADAVTEAGGIVAEPVLAPEGPEEWRTALASAVDAAAASRLAVVLLLGRATEEDPTDVVARATRRAELLRACADASVHLPDTVQPELWLVTHPSGALPEPSDSLHIADAAPWAVVRCLANEVPRIAYRRLSLQPSDNPADDAGRLVRELCTSTDEDEIVLTAQGRFVPREQLRPAAEPAVDGLPFTLKVFNPGLTCVPSWEETALPEPGPGEVVVAVGAAALNYRDIMQSTGLLPTDVFDTTASEAGWGLECAGTVVACGPGVSAFVPGDRVAGTAPASLASHTVAPAEGLWHLPDEMAFSEAATMPVAFLTVHYSLGILARLQPGETVLIHAAAGGVGLAAVQYATRRGAQVIATAGSELKRDYLRAIGVEHVLDSRSLAFPAQVMEITGGQGVDVVLNSLAGEAISRSLELLRTGGRFIELGKRDIYQNKPLLLRPFFNNIAFFGVDLTKILADPRLIDRLLRETKDAVARGDFRPLPHTVFPAARVADAFAHLRHSRHIGKVVVAFDPLDEPPLVERRPQPFVLDPAGSYLVTGGTGGFGAATACWLADLGARHLALVSRRGSDAPEAQTVLDDLRRRGARATAYAADAADLAAMQAVVAQIEDGGHPLRGVVHAAMHLDDEEFLALSPERITSVLAPKIGGAAVLDALTRDRDCDLFLMYSSGTTLIGNITQAPYAAGNLYLEALARRRHKEHRTGLTIAWGALGEVGYVVRNDLIASLAALGLEAISPSRAFATAEEFLQSGTADVAAVLRCDWSRARRFLPLVGSPRLAGLSAADADDSATGKEELLRMLEHTSTEEVVAHLTDTVRNLLAGVLQMDADQIDPHRRLDSFGLDSLMGTELMVKLQQRYEVDIPPMELMRSASGTVTDLVHLLRLHLGMPRSDTPADSAATVDQV
ncbi:SDR family NAD(P)-dependent oxidoreductase [Streptomyces sp. NPDC048595]|uniref:SDR family NAD(P)-dependent oxidoreductase n=1 Tax=Streptomyces sp. NPDC048595 TaxID=3365576 RepID=UPI00372146BE